ncbi:MAG: ribbon-helix-helix protein, CopG family [Lachnospiraceae bacterium]|nr:ribbon-helix-helix protein, CopG family [Lachnospiraceae bacterium]
MDLLIRNLEPYTIEKLNQMARKRQVSRNELVRRYLNTYAQQEDLANMEDKYEALVQVLADKLEQSSDLISQNTALLQIFYDFLDRLEGKGNEENIRFE